MKNIHLLETNEISKLIKDIWKNTFSIVESFNRNHTDFKGQYMYITNDDVIKEGDPQYDIDGDISWAFGKDPKQWEGNKKIILTNDLELIKEGVQPIDDEFLEWFVKNPTCEYVKVKNSILKIPNRYDDDYRAIPYFKIKIPKDLGYTTKSGIEVSDKMVRATMIPKEYFGREEDEMMEVPMPISKEPKKEYTEQDMLLAAKYGYNFHKTTSFPDQEFEDSCVRNTQQWLTTLK